jgi:hypothetical protein
MSIHNTKHQKSRFSFFFFNVAIWKFLDCFQKFGIFFKFTILKTIVFKKIVIIMWKIVNTQHCYNIINETYTFWAMITMPKIWSLYGLQLSGSSSFVPKNLAILGLVKRKHINVSLWILPYSKWHIKFITTWVH